ncbi:CRYAB.2 family protein [Megaselia abdita]
MSLIPIFSNFDRLMDHDFGLSLTPDDIFDYYPRKRMCPRRKPYDMCCRKPTECKSVIGKDGFQVSMDVQQFQPNELTVKTVDRTVIVEGKHEEKQDDHGFISRQFVRKYQLPKGFKAEEVTTSLSSDGVLTVKAPKPKAAIEGKERILEIQQTGPAHLSVKDNSEKEKDDKMSEE